MTGITPQNGKIMVTGGTAGLGLRIVEKLGADNFSRANGWTIPKDSKKLAVASLDYNIVINNAYDGVLGDSWHGFGQVELLHDIAMLWKQNSKTGTIINIGGVGGEDISAPFAGWESYNANKRALKHLSLQWTQAFRTGQVGFRTSLLTIDRLDTSRSRSMPSWTGNGMDLDDVLDMIDLCLNSRANTCIGEIKAWVSLDHKQQ